MAAPTVLAFSLGLLVGVSAQDSQAIAAAACLMSAWNAHDVAVARKCYVTAPVTVRGATRAQVDWGTEAGYREFDGVTHAVFRYEVVAVTGNTVEIALHERNDFLSALGLRGVTARWRYVVQQGLIAEQHHLEADAAFAAAFRRFTAWGRTARPSRWREVLGPDGDVRFNRHTAPLLVALAREWTRERQDDEVALRIAKVSLPLDMFRVAPPRPRDRR